MFANPERRGGKDRDVKSEVKLLGEALKGAWRKAAEGRVKETADRAEERGGAERMTGTDVSRSVAPLSTHNNNNPHV